MKYLRAFENHSEYYFVIDQAEFDRLFERADVFCFTDKEISLISSISKQTIEMGSGQIVFFNNDQFAIFDKWDMDAHVDADKAIVHFDDKISKTFSLFSTQKNVGVVKLDNFSVRIETNNGDIFINKCFDEWYLVDAIKHDMGLLYKCDGIDGVLKFIEKEI